MEEIKEKKKWYQKSFFHKLFTDKWYFLSLIITSIFLGNLALNGLKKSEGLITKTIKAINTNKTVLKLDTQPKTNGTIYTSAYQLDNTFKFSGCNINGYNIAYEENDGIYTKYFYNECLGSIKIEENLNIIQKEKDTIIVDNKKYKKNTNINISEVDIPNIFFKDDNIIFETDKNLIYVKESNVTSIAGVYNSLDILDKRIYKKNENLYRFIVFKEEIPDCNAEIIDNNIVYIIYELEYDKMQKSFKIASAITTRYKNEVCDNYENDINSLKQ